MTGVSLRVHPGPPSAPASASRVGLFGDRCVLYTVVGSAGPERLSLGVPGVATVLGIADLLGRSIGPDDELSWAVHPMFDPDASDVGGGYRAAAVTIDLTTDDGRRLIDVIDHDLDGGSVHPRARPDIDVADQWNLRRVSLAALAGATIVAVDAVFDAPMRPAAEPGEGTARGWIDGVRIEAARYRGAAASGSDRVLTTRGTHSSPQRSRGLTSPLTGSPHGGIHIAPATDLSNAHWTYTWNAHGPGARPRLAGMLVSRAPSIWIGDRGALGVRIGLRPDADFGVAAEEFDHAEESAHPHRYDVRTLSGIRISATATDHAALIEADLPRPGRVVLTSLGVPLTHARLRRETVEPATSLEVEATSTLPSPHERDPLPGFAAVRISGGALRGVVADGRVIIETEAGLLRVEIGASQISIALARHARTAVEGRPLAGIAETARERWDEHLGIVESTDADDESRMLLASDLYRLFLFPTRHDEDTADGPVYPSPTRRSAKDRPDRTGREIRPGRMLTDNGFWDTYRTSWPAYALLAPDRAGALLDGMLEHVRDGGWSPRWTAGTPLDAMVGTSLDVIAADLVSAGVPGIDLDTAYAAALRNATTPPDDSRFGRKGMPAALFRGYVSADVPESVSWTLEGAVADAGAAVLARALARRHPAGSARRAELHAEARYLAHRAGAYRSLWDAETSFFRPRTATGRWADDPFDPRIWGGAHTETNAWTSRFGVSHDGAGLAALFGGRRQLRAALDEYFRTPETAREELAGSYGAVIHEMVEARDVRRGMWGVSNQPAHHIPWLYAHTDTPWRAGDIVRDALDRLFRGIRIGQGYPGDEDNGEMSAWRLFGALGWAPYAPGSGQLLILPPRHDRVEVSPLGAPPVTVRVQRDSADDRYIHAVRWNGRSWAKPTIGIAELHHGGVWEVDLGPTPARWSEPLDGPAFFAPDGVERTTLREVDCAVVGADGARRVAWGDAVTVRTGSAPVAAEPALLILALGEPGVHAFDVEVEGLPGAVVRVREARWTWAGQAKPFEVSLPPGAREFRLRWRGDRATITAMQLLVAA